MLRKRSISRQVLDATYAVVFVLLLLPSTLSGPYGSSGAGVLVGFGVALAIRRRSPRLSLALAWVLAVVQMVGGVLPLSADTAIFAILYCSAAYGDSVVRRFGLASAVGGGVIAALYLAYVDGNPFGPPTEEGYQEPRIAQFALLLAGLWAMLGLSWALGRLAYARRTAIESAHARELAEVHQARAEHEVAIEQERNRIARDMHDIVAHSLAVVIAQADGARYVRAIDPAAVDTALTTISDTARDALTDVRVLLGQLRHSQGDLPNPTPDDLERLFDQVRATGLTIDSSIDTTSVSLGAGAHLALYRIAQESLTNALRHGDPDKPVSVTIESDSAGIELTVRNTVRSVRSASESGGHGIAGMKERASLAGGMCTASGDGSSWTVTAWLPAAGSSTKGID
ncbi:two-component sensor histidine kinase [Rhodococcus sp. 15-725-2-2b]|uniref:sensor histidine kinase n=1 Tax=unclassified Rhodococcus (in: high G+C Gram-positive bacteria) TaxID=192944 RepID=UPI000B9ABB26|nr:MULTISPECIES: sensor histidine kinase [unclassified Rhodococcus (in: high G+C Gram-positive bacteria)]OZC67126.1 two-component sensor histidine kinase [Rhodococcus sp. 06-470-2]OZC72593.1 two-component sensor histidine kinase [Rhodococcus sp. 06-469-3-2]OZC76915.1 two-component sensor histidine kinase [Rhodococcus sp. 06-418-5]OZD48819.1 two-component sensor histidine kinase [Rhodococcus sp. 06-1477-1A]OZE58798.1 two-component sensor histidine kinase [Rhodococcus sp. 05-2221-1B]